jgi:hypothetical protein
MARALLIGVLAVVAVVVPTAAADTVAIDFETPPPAPPAWDGSGNGTLVTDAYLDSAFTTFVASDFGFRPFRNVAPGHARSGSVVADVGPDICYPDTGDAGGCEFAVGGSSGRLTRTAQKVTLYAGLFSDFGNPSADVTAQLIAYRANDTVAATGAAVPLHAGPFDAQVTVASAAPDIARWELHVGGSANVGAAVGFDDLTMDFPTNSIPDFSLSATHDVQGLLAGLTTDVPVAITRLNGSSGPVALSVSGLPAGVTAQVVPNPAPGGGATVRLTAAPDAPAFDVPRDVTITGDPQGDGDVGQAPRSITVPVRVAAPFGLRADGATTAPVPACASIDVPFTLMRDRAFGGTVTLAAENLPQGVSAQILPGTTIAPGGNFYVTGTLRLTGSAVIPPTRDVTLRATSPGAADQTLAIRVSAAAGRGTLDQTVGLTPRALKPGTTIHVSGPGFCPGTTVRSGPLPVPATADADGRGLTFTVPRFAMPGAVTITPPAGGFPAYTTTNALDVRTFRGTYGFPFKNYDYGTLGIDELTDEFGADDLFITINPCWPFGSCRINTGVLDPVAAVVWGVLNIALHSTHGHCFGMSRAVQELIARKTPYARFSGTATVPFELPSATGPSSGLSDWLDAKHAAQGSSEFLNAWAGRDSKVAAQVARARAELAAGRFPIITLAHGGITDGEGHAMLVYDVQPAADGGTDLYVYDNNRPQTAAEIGDASQHRGAEEASVVHTTAHGWTFGAWSGGDDGKLFIAPFSTIPDNPSLPGLTDLASIPALLIFGSDGAARTADATEGAQLLPALDDSAAPGANGFLVIPKGRAPRHELVGVKTGSYSEVATGRGTAAGVAGVDTAKGVKDTVSADVTGTPSVAFTSGAARALDLTIAKGDTAATVSTHAARGGRERASVTAGGALSYAHTGRATSVTFTVTRVRRDGGGTTFVSPSLRVGDGGRISARPAAGGRMRITMRRRDGSATTRLVRSRPVPGAGRVRVGAVKGSGRRATARMTIAGLKGRAVLGAVLRVQRGGRAVTRATTTITRARNGAATVRFALPKLGRGTYRFMIDARLATSEGRATTVTARRAATIRVR